LNCIYKPDLFAVIDYRSKVVLCWSSRLTVVFNFQIKKILIIYCIIIIFFEGGLQQMYRGCGLVASFSNLYILWFHVWTLCRQFYLVNSQSSKAQFRQM